MNKTVKQIKPTNKPKNIKRKHSFNRSLRITLSPDRLKRLRKARRPLRFIKRKQSWQAYNRVVTRTASPFTRAYRTYQARMISRAVTRRTNLLQVFRTAALRLRHYRSLIEYYVYCFKQKYPRAAMYLYWAYLLGNQSLLVYFCYKNWTAPYEPASFPVKSDEVVESIKSAAPPAPLKTEQPTHADTLAKSAQKYNEHVRLRGVADNMVNQALANRQRIPIRVPNSSIQWPDPLSQIEIADINSDYPLTDAEKAQMRWWIRDKAWDTYSKIGPLYRRARVDHFNARKDAIERAPEAEQGPLLEKWWADLNSTDFERDYFRRFGPEVVEVAIEVYEGFLEGPIDNPVGDTDDDSDDDA